MDLKSQIHVKEQEFNELFNRIQLYWPDSWLLWLPSTGLKLTKRNFQQGRCATCFVLPVKWNSADPLLQNWQESELQLFVATEQETEKDAKLKQNSSWEWTNKMTQEKKLPRQISSCTQNKTVLEDRNKPDDEDQLAPHGLSLGETRFSK